MYLITFTEKNFVSACISYVFVNGTEIIKFKSEDPEILPYPLCLGNISRDWSVNNMKKNRIDWICL